MEGFEGVDGFEGLLEKLKPGTLNKPVINKGLLKFDDSKPFRKGNGWKLPFPSIKRLVGFRVPGIEMRHTVTECLGS